jgi:predicted O-methyltransferase YrrM
LIETFLLIAALRIVSARNVFEFGTFKGAMTLNMALNLPAGSNIYTFDLDPKLAERAKTYQNEHGKGIAQQHLEQNGHMEFDEICLPAKIHQLEGDSHTFNSSFYERQMDLVFVDGGHDRKTLAADTANAFRMATHGCIVWHDYGNPDYPDVAPYLDELNEAVFHVQESRLCFWFFSPNLRNRLST